MNFSTIPLVIVYVLASICFSDALRQNGLPIGDLPTANDSHGLAMSLAGDAPPSPPSSAPPSPPSSADDISTAAVVQAAMVTTPGGEEGLQPASPPTSPPTTRRAPRGPPTLFTPSPTDDRLSLRRPPQAGPLPPNNESSSPTQRAHDSSGDTNDSSPPAGSASGRRTLFVKPPMITQHPGTERTLECLRRSSTGTGVTRLPKKRTVLWQHKSPGQHAKWKAIQRKNKRNRLSKLTIVVRAGQYRCLILRQPTTIYSTPSLVYIYSSPSIIEAPRNQSLPLGGAFIKLTCRAGGYPKPKVTWKINKLLKQQYENSTSISLKVKPPATVSCEATSNVGQGTDGATAYFNIKPTVDPRAPTCRPYNGVECAHTISPGTIVSTPHHVQPRHQLYWTAALNSIILDPSCRHALAVRLCRQNYKECSGNTVLEICSKDCIWTENWYCHNETDLANKLVKLSMQKCAPPPLSSSSSSSLLPSSSGEISANLSTGLAAAATTPPTSDHAHKCSTLPLKPLIPTVHAKATDMPINPPEDKFLDFLKSLFPTRALKFMVPILVLIALALVLFVMYARKLHKRQVNRRNNIRYHNAPGTDILSIDMGRLPANSCYHQRSLLDYTDDQNDSLTSLEFPRNDIVYTGELSKGAFGRIFKAVAGIRKTGKTDSIVVKVLNEDASPRLRSDFRRTVETMAKLTHPNIVTLYGICSHGEPQCMLLEYMKEGALDEYLRSCRAEYLLAIRKVNKSLTSGQITETSEPLPLISDQQQISIARQIAGAMVYISRKSLIHRDLAARNCLVTTDNKTPYNLCAKISDFGMTRELTSTTSRSRKGHQAFRKQQSDHDDINEPIAVRWMSPETLSQKLFTVESDIWSFGVLMWEIFTFGLRPYGHIENSHEVVKFVVNGGVLNSPISMPTANDVLGGGGVGGAGVGGGGDTHATISDSTSTTKEAYELMRLCWGRRAVNRPPFIMIERALESQLTRKSRD